MNYIRLILAGVALAALAAVGYSAAKSNAKADSCEECKACCE